MVLWLNEHGVDKEAEDEGVCGGEKDDQSEGQANVSECEDEVEATKRS